MNNFDIQYLEAKSGDLTLKINNYFVHSKYDPRREAKQIAEKQYIPHHTHIVFGYGYGYLIDALKDQMHFNEVLLIIDPLSELTIREEHKQLNIFNENVIENLEFIVRHLAADTRTTFNIICSSNYDKLFPEMYRELLLKIKGIQYQNRTNDYTLLRYANKWQVNFVENLYHLSKDFSLGELENAYSCPVVIASGGPSLSKQLPQLKKIRDNILLIAAGSTVNSLLAFGIEPDYVVSIDGGEPNYKHFKDLKLENSKIIYTMQNHPGVREAFLQKGYCVDINGLFSFSRYLKEQVKVELPLLEGGGTVAHISFSIAQYISSGPIAMIGQDLAYTDNLTHAANNKNARQIDEEFIKKHEAFQTEGYNNNLVYTSPPFYSMKLDFEQLIKMKPPKTPFYNCTEGGIKLEGFEDLAFVDFCDKYVKGEKVTIINHNDNCTLQFDVDKLLKRDIDLYNKLIYNLTNGLSILLKNRSNSNFEQNVLKKLELVDQKTNDLFKILPIESVTAPVTLKVMNEFLPKVNETPEESYQRVKEQTKTLYKKLMEAVQFTKNCTEEILLNHKQSEEQL
ncbi:motility associated factor glycosyltransferase family protein [Ureibacillus sinduriensis]|uniref:motility associated factor glycosyltransferase family protein n=1 Tax=Ureibacillus sinduriensis TaxID=561440 RepID=UPI000689A4C1|nr:6-hydroxymethylpterin diphosphokinase MptE-like protein [Ureibacillus sinduriensis]